MSNINIVCVSGNLTRDPEVRYTANGTPVLGFSVAVNESRKDRDGHWVEVPNYVECSMFGNRAEAVSKYLRKGTKALVKGRLRYSTWESDGQKRSRLEVVAEDIEFHNREQDQPPAYQPQAYSAPSPYPQGQQVPAYQPQAYAPAQYPQGQQVPPDIYGEEVPF